VAPLRRIVDFMKAQGAVPAIQLAHAGRKAGTQRPWEGHGPLTEADRAKGNPPWTPLGPSAVPAAEKRALPLEMTLDDIATVKEAWRVATLRALDADFDIVELHGAHGYLLHTFLSPLSNVRTDRYGGDAAGRMRFPLELAEMTRGLWPADRPVFYRASAVDEGGWTIEETITFARELKARGVEVIDCSSGSLYDSSTANLRLKRELGFQVPFAERIRKEAGIKTMAVGLIIHPRQAEKILVEERADLIAIGREALLDPTWPLHAQLELDGSEDYATWPRQHGWWLERRDRIFEKMKAEGAFRVDY
jgi:2,4-dienoyl-CoA reductase-like NADH-dependent reductase (Old Yellow Enzyme family)